DAVLVRVGEPHDRARPRRQRGVDDVPRAERQRADAAQPLREHADPETGAHVQVVPFDRGARQAIGRLPLCDHRFGLGARGERRNEQQGFHALRTVHGVPVLTVVFRRSAPSGSTVIWSSVKGKSANRTLTLPSTLYTRRATRPSAAWNSMVKRGSRNPPHAAGWTCVTSRRTRPTPCGRHATSSCG